MLLRLPRASAGMQQSCVMVKSLILALHQARGFHRVGRRHDMRRFHVLKLLLSARTVCVDPSLLPKKEQEERNAHVSALLFPLRFDRRA